MCLKTSPVSEGANQTSEYPGPSPARPDGLPVYCEAGGELGWLMGFEPTTTGITIQATFALIQ